MSRVRETDTSVTTGVPGGAITFDLGGLRVRLGRSVGHADGDGVDALLGVEVG